MGITYGYTIFIQNFFLEKMETEISTLNLIMY